jgi:hypothetical protein
MSYTTWRSLSTSAPVFIMFYEHYRTPFILAKQSKPGRHICYRRDPQISKKLIIKSGQEASTVNYRIIAQQQISKRREEPKNREEYIECCMCSKNNF